MKSTQLYDASIYPYLGVANSGYPVVLFTERNQGMDPAPLQVAFGVLMVAELVLYRLCNLVYLQ